MNGIPASVKAGADRANALINQLKGTQTANDQGAAAPESGNQDTPADGAQGKTDENQSATLNAHEPAPEKSKPEGDETSFRERYFTLKGKYDSEVPRLSNDIRILQAQIRQFERDKSTLASQGDNDNHNQNGSNNNNDTRLNPKSMKEYGADFELLTAQVNQLLDENRKLKEQVGSVQQDQGRTRTERYLDEVRAKIEKMGFGFEKINADPNFLAWLNEPDRISRIPRHESLRVAEKRFDVDWTVAVFKEYLDLTAASPQKNETPKPKPNIQPTPRSTGADIASQDAGSTRIWTGAMIKDLYAKKRAGGFRGRDDEFKALELDMFQAQQEGRVKP